MMKEQILCATVATATSCSTAARPLRAGGRPTLSTAARALPQRARARTATRTGPWPAGARDSAGARHAGHPPRAAIVASCPDRGQMLFHKTHNDCHTVYTLPRPADQVIILGRRSKRSAPHGAQFQTKVQARTVVHYSSKQSHAARQALVWLKRPPPSTSCT